MAAHDGAWLLVDVAGGLKIKARSAGAIPVGSRVVLSVRPERVSLDASGRDNRFRLRLESIVYVGDASRLILSGPFASEFVVKTDRAPGEIGVMRGQEFEVGWNARDCLAFTE